MFPNARDLAAQAERLERTALLTLGNERESLGSSVGGTELWDRLSAASRTELAEPSRFSDESGSTRAIAGLLLRHIAVRLGRAALTGASDKDATLLSGDDRLWAALLSSAGVGDVDHLLHRATDSGASPAVAQPAGTTLEVWTETELCGLHALWWLAERDATGALADRIERSARWLTEYIQPDNATNRPWAAHVFVIAAAERGDIEAELFAGQLIHNALMHTGSGRAGRPDRFSAWILLDSALALRTRSARR